MEFFIAQLMFTIITLKQLEFIYLPAIMLYLWIKKIQTKMKILRYAEIILHIALLTILIIFYEAIVFKNQL